MLKLIIIAVIGGLLLCILGIVSFAGSRRQEKALAQRLDAIAQKAPTTEREAAPSRRTDIVLDLLPSTIRARGERALAAAGNKITLQGLVLVGIVAAAIISALGGFVLHLGTVWLVMLAGITLVVAPWQLLKSYQSSHKFAFLGLFADAIELTVRAVRAGLPVSVALDAAGREVPDPVGGEFKRIIADMRIGIGFNESLQKAALRVRIVDFDFFVACLIMQRESGGNLAETLGTLATVLRKRTELRSKTKALTAEARTSAWVLGSLPFVVSGAMMVMTPSYFGVLLTDPAGGYILGASIGLISIGAYSMRALIQSATS
jgi:Flp pilus assembly protein TadB